MARETNDLFARAQAAIAEARRLTEINAAWQDYISQAVDRMFLRSRFEPSNHPTRYPQDCTPLHPNVNALPE
ncbi:hypothetical protein JQ625_24070 [Bradyrhizobium diazoefficiens]|nr:hypothetical protein [Bradyrhizobium diazoefficiens]MBR0777920.1 hypothetical protein [Bradyrhizobium diazoefficiens]